MAKVIGIDLGTTNSVIGHEDHTGVDVVLNGLNERGTPSVVGLPKAQPRDGRKVDISIGSGDLAYGSPAVDGAHRNPEHTIFSIKRLMGRVYDDPNVQEMQQRYFYRIVKPPDADDVRVMLGDRMLTPTEVSAMILRKLKQDAEKRLGDEVTHAVITVPAYFSMSQRLATRMAGEMAGLRVKTILDEPSAAAIAFGVDLDPGAMSTILVYDLGGGTFDISILFVTGPMFNQMAIEGDMWLGGDDFDYAIVRHVLADTQRRYGVDLSKHAGLNLLLKKAAERAKIRLSELRSTDIVLDAAVPLPNGEREDIDLALTRDTFEDLPITSSTIRVSGVDTADLRRWCDDLGIDGRFGDDSVEYGPDTVRNRIKKTILLTRKAMKAAGVTRDQIDHVLLVGGSTTMPLVQRTLEQEFGAGKIMRNIDPMACVGLGAAIAAERVPGLVCQSVVGKEANGRDRLCLEVNDPNATACRKCGATLSAEKTCPTCGFANAVDAERCANPACGHTFERIDLGRVTAKPIGILAAGGVYEVIVPGKSPYPTRDPFVRTFRTATGSQKAVRVPIYDAEVGAFSPDDPTQWVGAADIKLEGEHLPAGTRVDVGISIDGDGCLDVEAIIRDGSGRRQHVYIDPSHRLGARSSDSESEEEGAGRDGRAGGEEELPPRWLLNCMWSVTCAQIALRDYEWLFSDHRATATLQRLVGEGRAAIERKVEAECGRIEKAIDDTMESALGWAMLLLRGEMACLNPELEESQRNKIKNLIREICQDIRDWKSETVLLPKLQELIEETKKANSRVGTGTGGGKDRGTYLES